MMKHWKHRWRAEIDACTPPLREDVRTATIPVTEKASAPSKAYMQRPFFYRIAAVACALALLVSALTVYLMNPPYTPPAPTVSGSIVSVQINPSICFVLNENGTVSSVTAMNADADVILSDEGRASTWIGKSLSEAVILFTQYAAELGYITDDTSTIILSTAGTDTISLSDATHALQDYLDSSLERTIDICANTLSNEQFCDLFSLPSNQADHLTKMIKDLPMFYTDRLASEMTPEEMEELYKSLVFDNELQQKMTDALDDALLRAEAINGLYTLSEQILHHTDNYWRLDPWTVQNLGHISDALSALCREFDNALSRFEQMYTDAPKNLTELTILQSFYQNIPVDLTHLRDIIPELNFDSCQQYIEIFRLLLPNEEDLWSRFDIPDEKGEMASSIRHHLSKDRRPSGKKTSPLQ